MEETRRSAADRQMPHPLVFIAVIATFIAILSYIIRAVPSPEAGHEVGGAIAADALRRAQFLYERLTPGEAHPAFRVVCLPIARPDGAPREQVMVSSAEEGTTARFLVTYEAGTGRLRRLTWSRGTRRLDPGEQGAESTRQITARRDAVLVAHRFLRLAGIDEAGNPWTEAHVARVTVTTTPNRSNFVWHLQMTSDRWTMWLVIDAITTEPTQILVLPTRVKSRS